MNRGAWQVREVTKCRIQLNDWQFTPVTTSIAKTKMKLKMISPPPMNQGAVCVRLLDLTEVPMHSCFLGVLDNLCVDPSKVKVVQLCPTLCDPMDYLVHGILQARILEWVAFPFSRGSSQPSD